MARESGVINEQFWLVQYLLLKKYCTQTLTFFFPCVKICVEALMNALPGLGRARTPSPHPRAKRCTLYYSQRLLMFAMQHNAHYFSDGHTPQLVIMQRPQVICEMYFHVKILTKIAEVSTEKNP